MHRMLIVFFICVTTLCADFSIEKIFSVGYDRNDVVVNNHSDVVTGVDNFCVSGDSLYLLHSSQQYVLHYSIESNKLSEKIAVPAFAIDIAVQGDTVYVVTTDNKLHIINGKRESSSFALPNHVVQGIHIVDGAPILHLANGNSYDPTGDGTTIKGWKFAANSYIYTEKVSARIGKVTVTMNDTEISCNIPVQEELGSILPLGMNGNNVSVRLEIIKSHSPIQIAQKIVSFNINNRSSFHTTNIPNIHNNFSYNDCKQVGKHIYKMMLTPQGLDIVNLTLDRSGNNSWKYDYTHHYNDHLLQVVEPQQENSESNETRRISRSQIISNAQAYLGVYWSCNSKNTTGLKTLPDGSKIRTPSWVTSGTQYKIPYKWGGFSKVSVFKQKASQGKYAGSDYTKSVSWGDTYCVGVDCSGFVSRAWGTSKKYGTSTIGQVSTQYSSISKLKKGDALNKRGSHIVLVTENNPSGTVNVIEASGIDWAVSKRTRNLSSMSGYKPIYFNNVSEW